MKCCCQIALKNIMFQDQELCPEYQSSHNKSSHNKSVWSLKWLWNPPKDVMVHNKADWSGDQNTDLINILCRSNNQTAKQAGPMTPLGVTTEPSKVNMSHFI